MVEQAADGEKRSMAIVNLQAMLDIDDTGKIIQLLE
jgi:hypothetical protein